MRDFVGPRALRSCDYGQFEVISPSCRVLPSHRLSTAATTVFTVAVNCFLCKLHACKIVNPDISRARLLVLHLHQKKKREMILKPLNRTSPLHRFLRRNVLRSYLTAAPYRLSLVTPPTDFVSSPSLRGTPLIVPIDWRSDCIGNSSSSWDPSSGLSLPCALQEQANPFELASFQLTC